MLFREEKVDKKQRTRHFIWTNKMDLIHNQNIINN